jgi:uracil phosphoribosyltransferase
MPSRFPNLRHVDHPLIRHKVSSLRDRTTPPHEFRRVLSEVAGLMTYEVCRELETGPVEVETPLERTTAHRLLRPITIVPVLRAGLGMTQGILHLIPEARVGHIGVRRDELSGKPEGYYVKLPPDVAAGPVFLVDPMLATGGSAAHAFTLLQGAGCTDLRLVCLVAAPEGVARLGREFPSIRIYSASLDRELDSRLFIRPGLGDAGDRCFDT